MEEEFIVEEPMELQRDVRERSAAMQGAGIPVTAAALTVTLGLAAASWVVAIQQMNGMDMGVATRLGSFRFFVAVWVLMMAAMMLPGAALAVVRRAQASGRVRAVPLFVGSYQRRSSGSSAGATGRMSGLGSGSGSAASARASG
jgi:predicted metal-binding membrane protein